MNSRYNRISPTERKATGMNSNPGKVSDEINQEEINSYNNKVITSRVRRRGLQISPAKMIAQFNRTSSADLVVSSNIHHKLNGINTFLNTVFDNYAREYGTYFKDQIVAFDKKLEVIKQDIYLNSQAEKSSYPQVDIKQEKDN